MIKNIPIERVLFLDIETVPAFGNWEEVSPEEQKLWDKKTKGQRGDEVFVGEFYEERAGVMAEFGKIICISVGMLEKSNYLRIKSFSGDDEARLLEDFGKIFNSSRLSNSILCAHNGKEFDFPYLSRRMIINGIHIPNKLQLFGKKPWEVPHLDTLDLWKFGDYKHYTSLTLLANTLGIPSPKDDINGSQVRDVFYEENDIHRIATYCEKDTITVAQILLRLRYEPLLTDDEILIIPR